MYIVYKNNEYIRGCGILIVQVFYECMSLTEALMWVEDSTLCNLHFSLKNLFTGSDIYDNFNMLKESIVKRFL